jgi:uncharacterized protein YbjT (DUF2867 family)
MKVLLLGSTGLVGGEILKELFKNTKQIEEIILLGRRFDGTENPLLRKIKTDFNNLDELASEIKADIVICALGTTIKKAGSQENFRKTDFEYPYRVAEIAKANGASSYILISSIGANPESRVFYTKVKGETEKAISGLGYNSFNALRPSMILGDRKEFRLGEKAGQIIMKLLYYFIPPRYRPIRAREIASAAIKIMQMQKPGNNVFESDELKNIAA